MATKEKEETSTVSNEEIHSLLDLSGGGDNIITPDKKEKTVFTNTVREDEEELKNILDPVEKKKREAELKAKSEEEAETKRKAEEAAAAGATTTTVTKESDLKLSITGNNEELEEEEEEEEVSEEEKRLAEEKAAAGIGGVVLEKTLKTLFNKKIILPFEGEEEKALKDYNDKDVEELIEANMDRFRGENKEEVTKEFFESISQPLQYLAQYELNGGNDIKTELKRLLAAVEVKSLDPAKENDQDEIIRQWLTHTKFGSPEEIEAEVTDLRDRKKSEEKSKQYKTKLDTLHDEELTKNAARQEEIKNKKIEATKKYANNVFEVLDKGELGGLKIGKKQQDMIYNGLTQPQYTSVTGRPTTKLGHLLEKYQVLEPNLEKMSKLMWLLEDEEGFEAALKNKGATQSNEEVRRKLKQTEADRNNTSVSTENNDDAKNKGVKKETVKRNTRSVFSRT